VKTFDPRALIEKHLRESIAVKEAVLRTASDRILQVSERIAHAFKQGRVLYLCGNGGSAADAQHFAAEFVSRLTQDFERPALPAIALTTDTSFITAFANDCGYEGIFARQIEAFGKPGDIFFGISTSGGSKNVMRGAEEAKRKGLTVISLIGASGALEALSDLTITVPSRVTQYIQESHIAIEHLICAIVERLLYPEKIQGALP
jgi:D-sedoheptulose 7-phosphate isomerase